MKSTHDGRIDITDVIKKLCRSKIVHEIPGIRRAITNTEDNNYSIQTDGVNLLVSSHESLLPYKDALLVNNISCNDIHEVARVYGIAAARSTIVKVN